MQLHNSGSVTFQCGLEPMKHNINPVWSIILTGKLYKRHIKTRHPVKNTVKLRLKYI